VLLERLQRAPGSEAAAGGRHAKQTGRSWWALLYGDGHIVHEWDADPSSPTGHADWPRLAMLRLLRNLRALRLYCPNDRFVELGGEGDQSGRLFQFKVAARYLGAGGPAPGSEVLAHVVGQVTGLDGQCRLYAWEPQPEPRIPQIENFTGAPPGAVSDAYRDWEKRYRAWAHAGRGRLVGPLEDNVYHLAYHQVGRLSAEHLGLADGEGR